MGTEYFGLSDPQGHYFINNVPAGTVSIRAALIGYRPLEARSLRVLAGQTVTPRISSSRPLRFSAQRANGSCRRERPGPPHEVTSNRRIDGWFTDRLPVDHAREVLALQPGVVAGVDTGYGGVRPLSIRGGRIDEAVVYVDGVPVSPGYRARMVPVGGGALGTEISVGTNAVEEASVTTGAASAEFGNALSGVISIQTRAGGRQFGGALAYETDEPFGVMHGLGFNRIQVSLTTRGSQSQFFLSGVLEGQKSARAGFDAEKAPILCKLAWTQR